ncbi:MAG: hypothetical protein HKN20_16955, partial [Gemmatimonadetes bacterium]|nr:hypothetical protein [Gemmatimonadota bacterium]
IFFFVVNSSFHAPEYISLSNIDVEVRVQGTRELDFKNCVVYLQVEGNYRDTYFGDSWTATATITGSAIGSFTENRFSGAWDPAVHGAALGGINIRMNSQGTVIEELVFAYDITYATGGTYTRDIRANDLAFIQVTPWGTTQYGVEGWRTLDLVEEAEDWHIYGSGGEWRMGFDTFETNETSYIYVEFN